MVPSIRRLLASFLFMITQQPGEGSLSAAARTVQQKIVSLLSQFRQLDQDEMLDLRRLKSILEGPAPDQTVQAQLLTLLFDYFESAVRSHFISTSEYQKLESLTQRREEELRTYIRVEQQLRLHVDHQDARIKALEKFKEDRVKLMKRVHEVEEEKLKNERLYERQLEKLIEAKRSSVQLPKRADLHRNSIELNLSKLDELSRPKQRPSLQRSHIRRGSSVLEHKLSLPHLKSHNSDELLEKLGSPSLADQAKPHLRSNLLLKSQQKPENPKLRLLQDMSLLLKRPKGQSVTQRYYEDSKNYYRFADGHIHRQ